MCPFCFLEYEREMEILYMMSALLEYNVVFIAMAKRLLITIPFIFFISKRLFCLKC